jgi:hypothetical protein
MSKENKKIFEELHFSKEVGIGLPTITSSYGSKHGFEFVSYSSESEKYYTHNLYPQQIARMRMNSPTNGSILRTKTMLTKGKGFDVEKLNNKTKKTLKILNKKLENIDDILRQVASDYVTFNGFALKVKWGLDGFLKTIEHIPFSFVRCGRVDKRGDVLDYVVSNNWDGGLPMENEYAYSIPTFNPEYFGRGSIKIENGIPTPSDTQIEQGEQIIYSYVTNQFQGSSGLYFYPVPDYVSAFDCILTEIDAIISQKAFMNNGIGSKVIVTYPNVQTEEEKRLIVNTANVRMTDAKNNGGMVPVFGNGSDVPIFNLIEMKNNIKDSIDLKRNELYIIRAHGIPSILVEGENSGTGLNTTKDQLEQAYQIFYKTVINDFQIYIERTFNNIFTYFGLDLDLKIKNFTLVDEIIDVIEKQRLIDEAKSKEVDSIDVQTASIDSK